MKSWPVRGSFVSWYPEEAAEAAAAAAKGEAAMTDCMTRLS